MRWRQHLVALGIFVVVATVFLWPSVSRQSVFTTTANTQTIRFPWAADGAPFRQVPQSDQANLSHPWHELLTRSLRDEGSLPTWNPHSFAGGAPLYANGSSGQLAPVRLVTAALVSPAAAHELSSWLHLVAAGWCAYWLLRVLGARLAGGLAAGLTWQSSGFVLAWIHLEVVTATFVYLPLTVALIHRAVRDRSLLAVAGAGVSGALLLVSGHLLFALMSLLVAGGYGVALAVEVVLRAGDRRAAAFEAAGRLALTGGAMLGLAAVVLVPTAAELADSPRVPVTMAELRSIGNATPGEALLRVAWPDDLPLDADEINFQPFIGLVGAALAAIGFLTRRRRGSGLARVLVVVGLAAAVDGPVMWALHRLPLFDTFRPYGRLSLWATLGLVILVGHGADAVHDRVRPWLERPDLGRLGAAGVVVAMLLAVNTAQLVSWGRGANPTFWPRSAESVLPTRPVLDAARSARTDAGWPEMVVPVNRREPGDPFIPSTLGSELHTAFGIDATSGYDSTVPTRTSQMVRILTGDPVEQVLAQPGRAGAENPGFHSSRLRWDLLDRLGVGLALLPPVLSPDDASWGPPERAATLGDVVHSGPDGYLVRVEGWGSGPQLVAGTELAADDDDALRRFTASGFAYRESVLLTPEQRGRLDALPDGSGAGEIRAAQRATTSARIAGEADGPMWLLVPVNWHEGWSATLDGRSVPVVRVNGQRIALLVPEGAFDVRLEFRPPGLSLGLAVSVLTALALLALLALGHRASESFTRPRGAPSTRSGPVGARHSEAGQRGVGERAKTNW